MNILLIRHAQSVANISGLLISNERDGLTDAGINQIMVLKKTLFNLYPKPTLIFSSPWKRAHLTAQILYGANELIILDSRLAETNPGVYGSWLEVEFYKKYPDFNKNVENRYEGGESHLDMANRTRDWFEEEVYSRRNEDGLIVAVTHGGPISAILQHLLGISLHFYPCFSVANASLTSIRWRHDLGRFIVESVGSN